MPDVKFSNQYPYTDFHELNLDWVIKEVKYWSTKVGKTIQSINLTGTVGLVDTYTITYSDGSTSTFDVTNGNGISSVAKTGTAGLVDTYTITFQDGSTTTFEVHNGTASIDPTLTLSDYAADAKVTGDRISYVVIDKGFQNVNQSYSGFTVIPNSTVGSSGGVSSSTNQSVWQLTADRDFQMYFSASNYTPTGGYIALGVPGTRYRNTDNNLPTSGNPLSVSQGTTVNIAVYTSGSSFTFWWNNLGYKITPSAIAEIDDDIRKDINCIVRNASATSIGIYIPSRKKGSDYYFEILLNHETDPSINCDVWKLDAGYLVRLINGTYTNQATIISGGEWACALKIKNASDFMGGNYHGDEIINDATILIDGTPHTFTPGESLNCQSITILENTNLYNPDVANEHAATVARQITITRDNIEIRQRVKWERSYLMDLSYLGMFCVMRSVTDRGYSDTEFIPYNIGSANFNNPLAINNPACVKNRKLFGEYGTSSKMFFEMKCTHISPDLPQRPTYIYNGSPYNKMYFSFCPDNYNVTAGDVWEATHEYRLEENI